MSELVEFYGKPLAILLDNGPEAAEVWLTEYNEYRPYESLGDMPPATFIAKGVSTVNLFF